MNHILNAQQEETQAQDGIDWSEREALAYPKTLADQFTEARNKIKEELSSSQRESIIRHYKEWKRKRLTCKKYRISQTALEKIIKEESLV